MFADYSKPEALEKPFASWTEYAFFAWNKQFWNNRKFLRILNHFEILNIYDHKNFIPFESKV